jgi:hypothetical protein
MPSSGPRIFLFSRLMLWPGHFLILEAASGLADRSRLVFSFERIFTVETRPTMVAASIIFFSSLRAVSRRMLDVSTCACQSSQSCWTPGPAWPRQDILQTSSRCSGNWRSSFSHTCCEFCRCNCSHLEEDLFPFGWEENELKTADPE